MRPIVSVVENDVRIEREMNDVEFAQWQVDQTNAQVEKLEAAAKEAARAALLDKLGITADEAKLLLG